MVLEDQENLLNLLDSFLGSPTKAVNISTPTKGEVREDIDRLLRDDASGLGSLTKQVSSFNPLLNIYTNYFLSKSPRCM